MVASKNIKLLGLVLIFVLLFSSSYATLDTNLHVFYNHDETSGTNVADSLNNANLTSSSSSLFTSLAPGVINYAGNYTGSRYSQSDADVVPEGSNAGTIQVWIYANSWGSAGNFKQVFDERTGLGWYGLNSQSANTLRMTFTDSGGDKTYDFTGLNTSQWTQIVITYNTSRIIGYLNGQVVYNHTFSGLTTSADQRIRFGSQRGTPARYWDGRLDAIGIWNRSLTPSEVLQLYNSGAGLQYPFTTPVISNFSITAQDSWNGSAISNFSAFINNDPKINSINGVINTSIPQDSASLFNITIVSEDYFNRTYTNYNVSTNLNAILTQSLANFQALSVMLNQNVVYDNITIGSQVRGFNEPFNISAGLYNATFQKLGWYNQTIEINVSKLTNITYNFTGVHDARINLSVADAVNGSRLSYFDINVFNSTGFVQSVQTNNTFGNATLLQGYTYTFTYQNESYFSASSNLAVASAYNNLTLQAFLKGSMNLSVINSVNLTLLTQNVTLLVFNTTTLQTYNSLTGRFSLNNLREGGTYNLQLSAIGFNDSFYTFVYGESLTLSPYVTYMFPTGDEISINVQSVTGQIITNAVVNVSTFIDGTRTLIASKLTDGVGRARFNLVADQYYVLDISADGYQTQTAQIYADQESYLISLRFFEEIIFLNPLGGIIYNFTPSGYILSPNSTNFSFSVSSQFNDIEIFSFDLYDANNNLIFILSSSNSSGETLSQVVDLSAYNNTILKGVFFIKRFNQTGLSNAKFWRVEQYVPIFDTGGDSFRQFAQDNLSVGARLAIWGVIMLIIGLTLSVLGLLGYRLVIVMLLIQYVVFYFLGAGGLEIAVNSIITLIIGYNAITKSREEFN